jgi:hypothetical protein
VYGLLAVCVALVVFALPGDDDPERTVLTGRTARGAPVTLVFYDGKLDSLVTTIAVRCPANGALKPGWERWPWVPYASNATFRHDGSRIHVSERWEFPKHQPPMVQVSTLRGSVDDDGDSVRGNIEGRWLWSGNVCEATVPFSARKSP